METSLPFRGHIKLFHLWLQEKNARANLKDEGLSDILGRRWNTFLSVLIELSDGWKIDIEDIGGLEVVMAIYAQLSLSTSQLLKGAGEPFVQRI
jgi:hypothetical protein